MILFQFGMGRFTAEWVTRSARAARASTRLAGGAATSQLVAPLRVRPRSSPASAATPSRAGGGVGPDRGRSFRFPVIGFSGRVREQRGRREPKTPHRKARASFLSRGILSAALPAQGAQATMPPTSGAVPPVNLVAFSAPRLSCRSLPASASGCACFQG
jgi:hypothetical protein